MSYLENLWLKEIIIGIEYTICEETKAKLFEQCGRKCAKISGHLRLAELVGTIGNDNSIERVVEVFNNRKDIGIYKLNGNIVTCVYPKGACTCPMVTGEYFMSCVYCCRGHMKERFEAVLKRPVTIEVLKTKYGGAEICEFRIAVD